MPIAAPAWPADHGRGAIAAFQDRALALRERCLSAIGPGEDLGAVVGGEDDNGIVVDTHVLELLHQQADVVVELRHAGFMDGPAVLSIAHRLVSWRQMSDDVHTRWINCRSWLDQCSYLKIETSE